MGSSRTVIHTVMLTQFWAHIWAHIPRCTFCVDLYLSFTLGGSQPCSGSSAAAVNEASSQSSLSCPVSCPADRYLEDAMASQNSPRPWGNQPHVVPSSSVGRVQRRPHPTDLAAAQKGHGALACHTETGPAALSRPISAVCMGSTAGRELRAAFISLSRFLACFWGARVVACHLWSCWGLATHTSSSVTGTPESLNSPFKLSAELQAALSGAARTMYKDSQ